MDAGLLLLRLVFGLMMTGFGQYSLDAVTGLASLWTPAVAWGALVIGAVAGIVNLGLRASAQRVVVS
jgi:hypothetical protein